MKMVKKTYDPGDIESLLRPKCDFQVSVGFKDRVMKEAQAMPNRRRRFVPWIASTGVAAAVVAVVCLLLPWHDNNMITPGAGLASSGVASSQDSADSLRAPEVKVESEEVFIAKAADDRVEPKSKTVKDAAVKKTAAKKKSGVTAPELLAKVDDSAAASTKEEGIMPLASGDVPQPMEMTYGDSGELVMEGIILSDEVMTPYKSEIYANVETISLNHKNMQLTEEEKLQVRRMEQMSYVSKMRLEVEMAQSLIQEVYRSIKM